MNSAAWVFREIAGQSDRGGAAETTILDGVDYRERVRMSVGELRKALERLEAAGVIVGHHDRWALTPAVAAQVPRTRGGQISIASEAWRDFSSRTLEVLAQAG